MKVVQRSTCSPRASGVLRERETSGAGRVKREQVGLAAPRGKHARVGQEHARSKESRSSRGPSRRIAGDRRDTWLTITSAMTSMRVGKRRDVVPRSQPRIDLGVVDRVEAGVGAVDRMEERQHVDAAERARQRPVEQAPQIAERAAGAADRRTR